MDKREMARSLALGRIALGAMLVIAPGPIVTRWIGDDGAAAGVKALARALGIRDLIIGAGTWQAIDEGDDSAARQWLQYGVAADAVDATSTLAAIRHIPTLGGLGTVAIAAGAGVAGVLLSDAFDS